MKKQMKVFRPSDPGTRKVILSTNIAETSVTIDDVVYVVDSGRINLIKYIPLQRASNLTMEWISKSNAIQRAGRAGRVRKGKCWHLFSRERFKQLEDFLVPEIKRIQLEGVVLSIKSLGLPINLKSFILKLIEPPNEVNVDDAINLLVQMEALDPNRQELTPLGKKMSMLPLHPHLSKMLIFGCLFKCLDPILSIVSILEEKDPFVLRGFRDLKGLDLIRKKFADGQCSDHLMFKNVMSQWEVAFNASKNEEYCRKNRLNERVLDSIYQIKGQLIQKLEQSKLVDKNRKAKDYNINSNMLELVKGVIACGLYPQINKADLDRRKSFIFLTDIKSGKRLYINQKSVNSNQFSLNRMYVAYFIARGNRKGNVQIQDCTGLHDLLVYLFTPYGKIIMSGEIPTLRRKIQTYMDESLSDQPFINENVVSGVVNFIENFVG